VTNIKFLAPCWRTDLLAGHSAATRNKHWQ